MFPCKRYKVTIRLLGALLGTEPASKSIWTEYVATKQTKGLKRQGHTEQEIAEKLAEQEIDVQELEPLLQGKTTFLLDDSGYYIPSYMLRANLKYAAKVLKESGALKQLQDKATKTLFIRPHKLYLAPPDAKLAVVERPIRCETAKGDRTAIARSESIPAGTEIKFEIHALNEVFKPKLLQTLLDYGQYQGLGAWRSNGCNGAFELVSFAEK